MSLVRENEDRGRAHLGGYSFHIDPMGVLMRFSSFGLGTAVAAVVIGLASGSADGASMTRVSTLAGDAYAFAFSVSADGSTLVGSSYSPSGRHRAFVWNEANGARALIDLPTDFESAAVGVSADGSTVVGGDRNGAFLWDEVRGRRPLQPTDRSSPYDVFGPWDLSSDGSTVVGLRTGPPESAFVWDEVGGARSLGDLLGGGGAMAYAVSADGSRVVGSAKSSTGSEAFVWDAIDGMRGLGVLPGGELDPASVATGISADGMIVVGGSSTALGQQEAFIWDAEYGMRGLGDLPNSFGTFLSYATDVSADGSIVVGFGLSNGGFTPFVWDAVHGMRQLDVLLTTMGVDLDGWTLSSWEVGTSDFPKISEDGRTIIGGGRYLEQPTGFVAVIPEPTTATLIELGLVVLVLLRGSVTKPV